MKVDLQKASILKRISAYTFDTILLACVGMVIAMALSSILKYDDYNDRMDAAYEEYGQMYGINVSMSLEEFESLSPEEVERYTQVLEAINADDEVVRTYSMVVNLTLIIASVSVLIGYLLLELLIPLWFGNGQTMGKKIFGIALMRTDGVKVTPFMMCVRTILGKYTVETMIPILIVIMLLFQLVGVGGTLVIALILLAQIIALFATSTNSAIHDLFACTVAVDMASQRMFESPEALLEYKKRLSAEAANRADY